MKKINMKRIFQSVLLAAFSLSWGGAFAATHVIDISTGIDNTTNQLIPIYTTPDDDWTVKLPGAANFQAVHCGTGIPVASWTTPYAGKDPNVRWLCPQSYLLSTGQHDNNAPGGVYEYQMTFDLDVCEVQSAQFNLDHIGGDNEIIEILVNGSSYPVSFSHTAWGTNVTIPVAAMDIVSGINVITVRVDNEGPETYTGMEINGDLTIVDNNPSPGFWLTYVNGVLQGQGDGSVEHIWNVYCTPNGNSGPYELAGTFDSPSFTMEGGCKCYYVTHTSNNECGEACEAQSICTFECDEMECNLSAPTGLYRTHMNATHDQFFWNPVQGTVSSYVLVLTLGDPLCCGDQGGGAQQAPPVVTFSTSYTFETVDLSVLPWPLIVDGEPYCYSWYVYAVCGDGSNSMASTILCSGGSGGGGIPDERPGSSADGSTLGESGLWGSKEAMVHVYPNPAREIVNIDIQTTRDELVDITVVDIAGKTVKAFGSQETSNGKLALKWDARSVEKGIYLVKMTTSDNKVITQRIVIE